MVPFQLTISGTRPLVLNESDQYGVIAWPFKLMVRPGDNLTELYDLTEDFGEHNNLAEGAPRRVGERLPGVARACHHRMAGRALRA